MHDPTTQRGRPANEGAVVLPFVRPTTTPTPPTNTPAAGTVVRLVIVDATPQAWRQAA